MIVTGLIPCVVVQASLSGHLLHTMSTAQKNMYNMLAAMNAKPNSIYLSHWKPGHKNLREEAVEDHAVDHKIVEASHTASKERTETGQVP